MARVWSEIEELDLTPPEWALIEACKAGKPCVLGDGKRPEGPDLERTIRAVVLRYLILGGCEGCRVQDWGVRLMGAFVTGELDLSFATARGATGLHFCRFAGPIEALQARFELLNLSGSFVPGLNAQGARVTGHVFLRNFAAEGEVRLSGAEIGGQLACEGGSFLNPEGKALNAQGVRVTGDVFLSNGFRATGEVSLSGAEIGGQLGCAGGSFHNPGGDALNVQRLRVTEGLYWRRVTVEAGTVDLASAHVGDLADDLYSWPEGHLILDGFTYGRITGAFTDTERRLIWLQRGTVWNGEFLPQPYGQLAKVLRDMGHERGARQVRIEQRRLTMQYEWLRAKGALDGTWRARWNVVVAFLRHCLSGLQRIFVGYGLRPFQSLPWLFGLWLIATFLAHMAYTSGAMVPNSDVILTSPGWQALALESDTVTRWIETEGRDWESFNRYAWGLDLVVPILDFGQTESWAPSDARSNWGWLLWWARWLLIPASWGIVGLFAAAITGIIRREDD